MCGVQQAYACTHTPRLMERGINMTKDEWLAFGYSNNIIEVENVDCLTFLEVYNKWIIYKSGQIKGQSLDRIECTYNKYYAGNPLVSMTLNNISENTVIDYFNNLFAERGLVSLKEYRKIYQIVNNVLNYAVDFDFIGARLLNWKKIKEYSYTNHVVSAKKETNCIRDADVSTLYNFVIDGGYAEKQSACLLLVLNFYLGLRVGELSALEWSDIDYKRKVLNVSRTEIKKYVRTSDGKREKMVYEIENCTKTVAGTRRVPLCDMALYILKLLKKHHTKMGYESERLLYDGSEVIGVRSLDRTLRRLCKLVEIQPFSTHMIRKTVATKMHYSGMPSRTIADILGHKEISTTEKCYILTDIEYFATVSHALNDVFVY